MISALINHQVLRLSAIIALTACHATTVENGSADQATATALAGPPADLAVSTDMSAPPDLASSSACDPPSALDPSATHTGYVTLNSTENSSMRDDIAMAGFSVYPSAAAAMAAGATCTLNTVIGDCTLTQCTYSLTDTATHPGFGTLSIVSPAGTIDLTQVGTSYPPPLSMIPALFAEGQITSITALGAAPQPGFMTQVMGPSTVQLTSPPGGGGLQVASMAQDLVVTWAAGSLGVGTAQIAIGAPVSGGATRSMWCNFPASAQKGVIPSAALQAFGAPGGMMRVSSVCQKNVVAGDFVIQVNAQNHDANSVVNIELKP
jgi:hypothetical protein